MSSKSKRIPAFQTHQEMLTEWKADPIFKTEYDVLEEEYQLLHKQYDDEMDLPSHRL